MLEIIAIYYLVKKNTTLATNKGRSKVLFALMTVGLWIFLEITFSVLGVFAGVNNTYALMGIALLGGVTGGLISFFIAKFCPTKSKASFRASAASETQLPVATKTEREETYCRYCGAGVVLPANFCDTCGKRLDHNT